MAQTIESPFTQLKQQASRFSRDVADLVNAHVELAKLEAQVAKRALIRTAVLVGLGVVLVLAGVSVLLVLAADRLAVLTEMAEYWWLLIVGGTALVLGILLALVAKRKLRLDLSSFEATLSELREDLYWLGERLGIEDFPPRH